MEKDIFEQCYQFNMKRNAIKREIFAAYSATQRKVLSFWHKQWNHGYDEFGHNKCLTEYINFVFWNNHPYWAWLLHEEFDDPNFLYCAQTVKTIAYTYRNLPTYSGLINYDMYQVAPIFF